jgi:hypothetical protein
MVTVGKAASTAVGSVLISVGNGNFATFTTGPAPVTLFLQASINPTGKLLPTGTVNFVDTFNGTATTVASNVAVNQAFEAFTASGISTFAPGNHSIVANYSGDASFTASSSPAVPFTITAAANTGTFSITSTAVTATAGSSSTSTIKVTPSGTFNTAEQVTVTCPATGGVAVAGVSCTPLTITIPTGTNPAPISMPLTVNVTGPSTSLSASSAPAERALYAAGIVPSTGGKGWWVLSAGAGLAAMLVLFLSGRKRYRAALGLGLVCVLSFALGCGGGGYNGGTTPVATTTKVSVTSTKVLSGTNIAFAITITASVGANGQVQLFDGSAQLGTPGSVTNGATTISNALPVGTHAISAHYLGDSKTMASQSGTLNVTVTGGPVQMSIMTSPAATPVASPINITIN